MTDLTVDIFLITFVPALILGVVAGQVMGHQTFKSMAITLGGLLISALLAILTFMYVIVPFYEKQCISEKQQIQLDSKVEFL